MKLHLNLIFLIAIGLIANSSIANAQVTCDSFTLNSQMKGSKMTFHLVTDLPDDTTVMVSVSRSYREKGNSSNYSLAYFSTKSTVAKLKKPTTIEINNKKWLTDLNTKNQKLSKLGLGFELESVAQSIDTRMVVPIVQTNPAFGKDNSKLIGKEVRKTGLKVVEDEVTMDHVLKLTEGDVNRPPNLDPRNLDLKQIYKVSKDTPLMPSHSPKDPLAALKQVKTVPKGGQFQVFEVYRKNNTPWYRVEARDSRHKEIGEGWINSTSLLGQNLSTPK